MDSCESISNVYENCGRGGIPGWGFGENGSRAERRTRGLVDEAGRLCWQSSDVSVFTF